MSHLPFASLLALGSRSVRVVEMDSVMEWLNLTRSDRLIRRAAPRASGTSWAFLCLSLWRLEREEQSLWPFVKADPAGRVT